MKTKLNANTSKSKFIQASHHFGKLFRRELIWIQRFPNIKTRHKYPSRLVLCLSGISSSHFAAHSKIRIIVLSSLVKTWRPLFEKRIALSTNEIAIQRIAWFVLLTLIHWIVIYLADSVIQPALNYRVLLCFEHATVVEI